jgi:pteridine reductase
MADSLQDLFGVEQPVALVTGSGAARVGRVIARDLAEAGYRVVLHAHRSVDQVKQTAQAWSAEGLTVSYVTGAVDDEGNHARWCQEIAAQHGGLHVLVNSAAVWEPGQLEQLNEAKLLAQWRVNLMGPALLSRTVGLKMAEQSQGGAIINIGDWAVVRPYRDFMAYLLSKSSIETLTRTMAVELALRCSKIRVNAVLPGPVMLDDSIQAEARQAIIEQALLKREGTPEDVARTVKFLIESPFVTGVCIPVDGGRTIHAGHSSDILAHPTYLK